MKQEENMLEIQGSVAVITGGASGIGLEMARYWLKNGGKVVIADVAEETLEKAAATLEGEVATVLCNVTKEEDCARLADTAIEKFGQINLVAPFAGITKDGMMVSPDRETGKVDRKMSLKQRFGSGNVAVEFRPKRGRVLHLMGHFYQKDGNHAGVVAMHRLIFNFLQERFPGAVGGRGEPE